MPYFVRFDEGTDHHSMAQLFEVGPEAGELGWYSVDGDILGKHYKLVDGNAKAMTEKQYETWFAAKRLSGAQESARHIRTGLLVQSDWAELPTTPMSDEKRAEWATYRQALRDFPTLVTDPDNLPALPVAPN